MIDGTDDQHQRVAIPIGLRDVGRTVYTVGDHKLGEKDGVITFNKGGLVRGKSKLIEFTFVENDRIGISNTDTGFIF